MVGGEQDIAGLLGDRRLSERECAHLQDVMKSGMRQVVITAPVAGHQADTQVEGKLITVDE